VDFKVSKKERRLLPKGPVDVFINNAFDLFPVFDGDTITGVEMLDDPVEEAMDRAFYASIKQRGNDPIAPEEGVRWAEALLGEAAPDAIIRDIQEAVWKEGSSCRAEFSTIAVEGKSYLNYEIRYAGG
jgi:hypothetical protein